MTVTGGRFRSWGRGCIFSIERARRSFLFLEEKDVKNWADGVVWRVVRSGRTLVLSMGFLPRIASLLAALLTVAIIEKGFALDIQVWNETCGARIRIYAYHPEFRLDAIALAALCFPGLAVRSRAAILTSLGLTIMTLLWSLVFLSSCVTENFIGECYQGGHENGPGQAVFVLLSAIPFVALNLCVPVLDWLAWAGFAIWRYFSGDKPASSA
jgi:hypothetical protein